MKSPLRFNRRADRAGLSLVEMMIALTMTLIVLGAMMSAFQFASAEMKKGRSIMELASRLRVAEDLLRRDLSNGTVEPVIYNDQIPNGYFEVIEGPNRGLRGFYGIDLNNNGIADVVEPGASLGDGDGNGFDDSDNNANGIADLIENPAYLDDIDDCLALTCRSPELAYRGRVTANTVNLSGGTAAPLLTSLPGTVATMHESPLAEIIWSTHIIERPSSFDASVAFDERVDVRRRVLLIRPDLNGTLPAFPYTATVASQNFAFQSAMEYLAANDISARVETQLIGTTTVYQIVANNLEDLSRRENRFCRYQNTAPGSVFGLTPFPHPLNRGLLNATRSADRVAVDTTAADYTNDLDGDGLLDNGDMNLDGWGLFANNSDVVLSDACGFDIKIFSPNAVVQEVSNGNGGEVTLLEPHDDHFLVSAVTDGSVPVATRGVPWPPAGQIPAAHLATGQPNRLAAADGAAILQSSINGAFVDLGHRGTFPASVGGKAWFANRILTHTGYALTGAPVGVFTVPSLSPIDRFNRPSVEYQYRFDLIPGARTAGDPNANYQLLLDTVWDQWTPSYENDGIDQDGDGLIDEFTDGIDGDSLTPGGALTNNWNNGLNGLADDVTERETVAPYPFPIRAIKITLRVVEKESKQVRQTSVSQNYIPQ